MFTTKTARAVLLGCSAVIASSAGAFAQSEAPPKKQHHHDNATDRLDLLEKEVHEQARALTAQTRALNAQASEIQSLKAQLGQSSALASAPAPQVSAAQFADLQNKVDNQIAAKKDEATVKFAHYNAYQHSKTVPTISSADGRYTFQPFVLLQGDWGSYSKSQPLSLPGTNNLKSSGENFRRARIGFQGIFEKDFSYSFIADFGGAGGDETYQAYAAANSGTTKNTNGTSISPYTANTPAARAPACTMHGSVTKDSLTVAYGRAAQRIQALLGSWTGPRAG